MRIIAGTARSMPLKTIEGKDTRPTTDRIKETLFNILQMDVPGSVFWICLPEAVELVWKQSAAVRKKLFLSRTVRKPPHVFRRISVLPNLHPVVI